MWVSSYTALSIFLMIIFQLIWFDEVYVLYIWLIDPSHQILAVSAKSSPSVIWSNKTVFWRVQGELSFWHSSPLRPWQNQSQDTHWFLYPTFIPDQNACPGLDPKVAHHDRMENSRPNTTLQHLESVFYTSLKVLALKWKFNNHSALKPGL